MTPKQHAALALELQRMAAELPVEKQQPEFFKEFNKTIEEVNQKLKDARQQLQENGLTEWMQKTRVSDPLQVYCVVSHGMLESGERAYVLRKLQEEAIEQMVKERNACRGCNVQLHANNACCAGIWYAGDGPDLYSNGYCKQCCPEHKDEDLEEED